MPIFLVETSQPVRFLLSNLLAPDPSFDQPDCRATQIGQYTDSVMTHMIRYDTIAEFNVDSKAEYSALSSTRSQKKKLKQTTPVPLWYSTGWDVNNASSSHITHHHRRISVSSRPCFGLVLVYVVLWQDVVSHVNEHRTTIRVSYHFNWDTDRALPSPLFSPFLLLSFVALSFPLVQSHVYTVDN